MKYETKVREIDWMPRSSFLNFGWGNGYVGVSKGHPWYGVDYEEIDCEVHGGLTYGKFEAGSKDLYWVGFDTAHCEDNLVNWSKRRVEEETKKLLGQAINAAKEHKKC